MKRIVYKLSTLLILVLIHSTAFGQFKDQKTIKKSAAFKSNGYVSVNNKHGNIQIASWSKDSIRIEVVIEGQSKSLSKLQEIMAKTTSNISIQNNSATIQTVVYDNLLSKGWSEIKEITNAQNSILINYKIYVPSTARLALSNRYGDIFINDHAGDAMIEVNHGNLRANSLPKLSMLHSSFGNIYIVEAGSFNANLYFSEVEIASCKSVTVDSKGSTYEWGEIETLHLTSTNDKISINEVSDLTMNGHLSKVRINTIRKRCIANLKYGRFRVRTINRSVCTLNFQTVRTTVDLGFDAQANFKVSGHHTDVEFISTNPLAHISTNGSGLSGHFGNNAAAPCNYVFSGEKSKIYFK